MSKRVTVVILSYNNAIYIENCLNSLEKQTYRDFDVIAVDNNSQDNSVELFSKYSLQLIQNKTNDGGCKGLNDGFIAAKSEYIMNLDIDTIMDENCLQYLVTYMDNHPEVAACQAKLLLMDSNKINSAGNAINYLGHCWTEGLFEDDLGQYPTGYKDMISGAAMICRKSVLDEVGLFDEDLFLYHEDSDLVWRMRLWGHKLAYVNKAVVYHKYSVSVNSAVKYYYLERNRFVLLFKNYELKTLFLISPALVFCEVGILAWALFNGFFIKKIQGYFWNLKQFPKTLSKRKFIQKMRKVNDRDIIRGMKGNFGYLEIQNPLVNHILNPFLSLYKKFILILL